MTNNTLLNAEPEARLLVTQAWPSAPVSSLRPMFGRIPVGRSRRRAGRRTEA